MLERHTEDCGGENSPAQQPTVVVIKNNMTAVVFNWASGLEDDIQIGEEVNFKGNVSGMF